MSWCVSSGFTLYGTLCAFWTWLTISFSMLRKFKTIISSKIFLYHFFFSSSSGTPYNSNVGVFYIIPEVSETVLSSFHSFYFILLFRSYFHQFIFQLTDSFFCFSYSVLIPSRVFLISIIVLFVSVYLFFNSSRSLLTDSYIFSILFSRSLVIFTIIILNSFSGSLFPLPLFGLLCF